MQLKPKPRKTASDLKQIDPHADGSAITGRREIKVAAGQTIVVHPRISPLYKAAIWFSFVLNALLLLALLTIGGTALRLYSDYRAVTGTLHSRLNTTSPVGQTVQQLTDTARNGKDGPATATDQSVTLAQQKLSDLLGAVEGLQNATIRHNVPINQSLPIQFQIPIEKNTEVVLSQPVTVSGPAHIVLPGEGGNLNAQMTMTLPGGTRLPIHLGLTVPVSSSVPLKLDVPVDIPVRETELAKPFATLQRLLQPVTELFIPAQK